MVQQENKKNSKKNEFFSVLVLTIGILILLLSFCEDENTQIPSDVHNISQDKNKNANVILNHHLQDTYDKIEIEKKHTKTINNLKAPSLESSSIEIPFEEDASYQFQNEDFSQLAEDLNKNAPESYHSDIGMHQQIMQEIKDEQEKIKKDKLYKENYAKMYIAKAKEKGFEVILDQDYKIVSVKKINKIKITNDRPSIFDLSGESGQGSQSK